VPKCQANSNERLAVGSADGSVSLNDLKTGREERLPNRHLPEDRNGPLLFATVVAFTPDGSTLVTAGADRTIRFWNLADGKKSREFPWSKSRVVRLALSPDGTRLAHQRVLRSDTRDA
jgi:WD40 repeat protein